jgi:hypothetical protein
MQPFPPTAKSRSGHLSGHEAIFRKNELKKSLATSNNFEAAPPEQDIFGLSSENLLN